MSFPRGVEPLSLPCFPLSAINRTARGGGLNWIYLAVHVRDISTDVSAANHRRSCAGVSKEPTISLNGKLPLYYQENALASFIWRIYLSPASYHFSISYFIVILYYNYIH